MSAWRVAAVFVVGLAASVEGAHARAACAADSYETTSVVLVSVRLDGGACRTLELPFTFGDASRDGTRVVGAREGGVYVADLDGGQVRRIVDQGAEPTLSPDGRRVSYRARDALWVVDADGTAARDLGSATSGAAWSPDSQRLVFAGRRSRPTVVDLVSDGKRELRSLPVDVSRPSETLFAWSPNGRWIAYQSSAGAYRIRPDGSGGALIGGRAPTWSPDSRRLAVLASQELWVVGRSGEGRAIDRITGPNSDIGAPAWGPGGRLIAYTRRETSADGFVSGLFVIAPDGRGRRLVSAEPSCSLIDRILWFPNGKRLLVVLEQTDCGMDGGSRPTAHWLD